MARRAAIPVHLALAWLIAQPLASRVARGEEARPAPAAVAWSEAWPRFRWWEYAATIALGATSLYLRGHQDLPTRSRWVGDNPIDDAIRGWLRADTPEGRARAVEVSNALSLYTSPVPFVVDLPVLLFVHRRPDVVWQVGMMDLEANAVAGFLNFGSFIVVGRGRPDTAACARDPTYDPLCGGPANNASLPSGHTLSVATAAGLVCVHHHYLPIFERPAADASACVVMSLLTAATAVSRVIADRHFATDTLVGAAIGFGSGYGIPWLLHYRYGAEAAAGGRAQAHIALLPFASPSTAGLSLSGLL